MTSSIEHPIALLLVLVLSTPIYKGLALAIFGNREGVAAMVKHLKNPDTWNPLRNPWEEDFGMLAKILLFASICIGFIVAAYDLGVRYVVTA